MSADTVRNYLCWWRIAVVLLITLMISLASRQLVGGLFANFGWIYLAKYNWAAPETSRRNLETAGFWYGQATAIDGSGAPVHLGLGMVYWQRAEHTAAREYIARAVALAPDNRMGHYWLAEILSEQGEESAAAEQWGLAGGSVLLHRLATAKEQQGNNADASLLYRQAAHLEVDPATQLFDLGLSHALDGRWDEAIRLFEKALELHPDSVSTLYELGKAWGWGEGDSATAIRYFEQITTIDPGYPYAYIRLGMLYERDGNVTEAIQMYQRALVVDPGNRVAREALDRLGTR